LQRQGWGVMFGPEHYSARASELEAAAKGVTNASIRASYLELAQRFREMAKIASLSQTASDAEIESLAPRMVGRSSGQGT
jgi:hypothetical protein